MLLRESSDTAFHIAEVTPEQVLPDHICDLYYQDNVTLDVNQKTLFKNLLIDKQDVFARPGEVGRTFLDTHKIKLKDKTHTKEPPRRIPLIKRHIIEEEITNLERKGLIEKSESSYSAPTVLVRKKMGPGGCVLITGN